MRTWLISFIKSAKSVIVFFVTDITLLDSKLFEEIGVDILMPAGVKDEETRRALPKLFPNTPMLADIVHGWGDEPHYTDKEFQDMGYKFVSQPFIGCFLALQRLADYFEYYRKNGEVEKFLDSVFPYEEYEKLLGIEDELNIMDTISWWNLQSESSCSHFTL